MNWQDPSKFTVFNVFKLLLIAMLFLSLMNGVMTSTALCHFV